MAVFDYRQAEEVRDAFGRHGCRYLFLGKSGAILLGFPDTTQDADVFVEKSDANGNALVAALADLGFALSDERAGEVRRGKDFVQLKNGPFDLDLIFAPDGIERFADAGNDASRWMASRSAAWTTSSTARSHRTDGRIASRCHVCCRSASTG